MDADEAARWGVVNRVIEPGELLGAARALAARVAAAAPLATRAVKAIVAATEGIPVEDGVRRTRRRLDPRLRPGARIGGCAGGPAGVR